MAEDVKFVVEYEDRDDRHHHHRQILLARGDYIAPIIAAERQIAGEISGGKIKEIRRARVESGDNARNECAPRLL